HQPRRTRRAWSDRSARRAWFAGRERRARRAWTERRARPRGTARGKLPIAKIWRQDSVTYEAEVVCYDGSLYQALKDTAQVPGGSDWICLALAGRDGVTPDVRGTYKPGKDYKYLDIVALNGGSFIARTDDPGECPGPGWQLLASRGKTGDKGLPGPRG